VLYPEQAASMLEPKVVQKPKTLEEKIAFRAEHLVKYQGNGLRQGDGGKGAENECNLFFYIGSKKCSSRRTESQVKEFGGGGGS